MDSIDVSHVPPPDPEAYWEFSIGQKRLVSMRPYISLTLLKFGPKNPAALGSGNALLESFPACAQFRMIFDNQDIPDWLNLDRPCVAIRNAAREPLITFTLREICGRSAFLQVSCHPSIQRLARTGVEQ